MTATNGISLFVAFVASCFAQSGTIDPAARRDIDSGNQTWIKGMKEASAAPIAMSYAESALDCPASGDRIQGRAAVLARMKDRFAKYGRASTATFTSMGVGSAPVTRHLLRTHESLKSGGWMRTRDHEKSRFHPLF